MQIVQIPRIDRERVAALIDAQKATLAQVWMRDPSTCAVIVHVFFSHLASIAVEHLGGPVALLLDFCTLRHNRMQTTEHHPWHTDASFFQPAGLGLTFWCPLDPVGDVAPGVTLGTPDGEVTPRLVPGDALVIPPELLHRTQSISGDRVSIEFRCAPVEQIPTNVGSSAIATKRRRGNQKGVLIEADGRLIVFLELQGDDAGA